ncbi:MTAP family purine nucleoside phosphorylase [Methanoplanus sp. FWC-SCC4]|uniref:MTAP family purine nucleoside phosphorylase n=1 Tax=Methanochimaera problematica TaxID=2609417 RepID=A0AA97FCD2_9EURY|nr:MTAP family purine nucleoside phosphorylase [Methanoplanus sp. FWC-SCC4]WOF16462.1 MTAP family purine nucleoside phosphorylase [Methanoplanus sp. FWC-SCC4]
MLGIVGGTSLLYADLPELEKKTIATPFGPSEIYLGEIALLMRHQYRTPPHKINYAACISAMALSGVDRIIAFGSTGSLKAEIQPGTIVLPDDYFSPYSIPTIHNNAIGHVAPSIDKELIKKLSEIIPEAKTGGTYVQTAGPRFETSAEIDFLKNAGDIVGMTVASEATIANELGIPFAAICSVDNYCNGLCKDELSYEAILEKSKANKEKIEDIISEVISKI